MDAVKIDLTTANVKTTDKQYEIKKETPGGSKLYPFIKRLFDIVVSFVGFLVCFGPMLLLGIIIKLDSKGPVIYKQERVGLNGKPFMIYKFRTMRIDAEVNGPQWASENDDRCTRVGRFLRNTRLDELPQLLNILSGKMSIVGPRPERECFYVEFEKYIHGFRNRLDVKPGLTGLAQINGGYDLAPEEKIVFDMEYIKNRSFFGDIKLIFKTVKLVFTHEGAR
ncbi:MAG: sugar transferase [Clostridia bacterium]|nr:sugar transferase [Clostridia bacterium]